MFRYILGLCLIFCLTKYSYSDEMVIKLPAAKEKGILSLEETIKNRRSERDLSGKELMLEEISQLLWSCQGITGEKRGFRAAPSAGATYPLEVYLVSGDGFFNYMPDSHSLKRIKDKDLREVLSGACLGQRFVKDAAIDIVICADFKRATGRYGKRGENYVYIEVGHAAENVNLQAVALGLGSVCVGAFSDDAVKELLELPKEIVPIYIIPVGYIKE